MENQPDPVHVLIVDDEDSIREGSTRILERIGHRVSCAENGTDALELLDRDPAHIVLLDMKMPGMDGMDVLQHIRDLDPTILVIVVTGFATLETAVAAMKLGAYDFIPKPFEPAQLRIVCNRAAERLRLQREALRLEQERLRTLADLDTEKSRVRTILESLPTGTLVTNNQGQVVLMNPALRRLLKVDTDVEIGSSIASYLDDEGLRELILAISRGQYIDFEDIPSVELSLGEQFFQVRGRPVLGERKECLGAVITVDDVTAMKTLDRLKSEFVAKVSHELRSPLATIHEQLAIVLSAISEMAPSGDRQMLARAKEKTHGLISLIGDLLDLSRIEEGTLCDAPEPVQLTELLDSIVSFLRTRADAKGQTLIMIQPDAPPPTLSADPLALESIFGNLITNAINYTPDGGEIRVTLDQAGSHLRVSVSDNGYGIEARHHEKIFDRFYRVKTDQTRFITGTGLGLPIVKQLVEALGGLIELESKPGRGTTFRVLLPLS